MAKKMSKQEVATQATVNISSLAQATQQEWVKGNLHQVAVLLKNVRRQANVIEEELKRQMYHALEKGTLNTWAQIVDDPSEKPNTGKKDGNPKRKKARRNK